MNNERNCVNLGNGYLYTITSTGLNEYHGEVLYYPKEQNKTTGHIYRPYTKFVMCGSGLPRRNFDCCSQEGVVYNRAVWLHESNKEEAATILLKYECAVVNELFGKIGSHEKTIDILKNVIRGD